MRNPIAGSRDRERRFKRTKLIHATELALCALLMGVLAVVVALATVSFANKKAVAYAEETTDNLEIERLKYVLEMETQSSAYNLTPDGSPIVVDAVVYDLVNLNTSNTAMTALSFLAKSDPIKNSAMIKGFVSNIADLQYLAEYVDDASNYEVGQKVARLFTKIGRDLYVTCNYNMPSDSNSLNEYKSELVQLCNGLKKQGIQDYYDVLNGFATTDFFDAEGNSIGYYDWLAHINACYTALYDVLQRYPIQSKESKVAFDDLYAMASQTNVLVQRVIGEQSNGVSLLDATYNYYLANVGTQQNPKEFLTQGVNQCVAFAYQVYSNYLVANTCLSLCYQYQAEYVQNGLAEDERLEDSSYVIDATHEVSYSSEVVPFAKQYLANHSKLTAAISRFYVRLLNLDQIYYMQAEGVTQKVVVNELSTDSTHYGNHMTINNRVPSGATLYLSSLPESLTYAFNSNYTYEVSDNLLASVSAGVVTVKGASGSFDVSLLCDGVEVYKLTFNIGYVKNGDTDFVGEGSLTSPILISNEQQIRCIAGDSNMWGPSFHYLLTKDITLNESASSNAIITQFEGVFDGGNHTITGKAQRPLFSLNRGTIKNLTVANAALAEGREDVIGGNSEFSLGGIVDRNEGLIYNCHLLNSALNPVYSEVQAGSLLLVGGITGHNMGTIERCSVVNSRLDGTLSNAIKDENAEKYLTGFSGSIAGYTGAKSTDAGYSGGTISDTLASSNNVRLSVKGQSNFIDKIIGNDIFYKVTPVINVGDIVGCAENVSLTKIVFIGNQHEAQLTDGEEGSHEEKIDEEYNVGPFAGKLNNTTVTEVYTDGNYVGEKLPEDEALLQTKLLELGWVYETQTDVRPASAQSLSIVKLPYKTIYNVGEQFNFAGLILKTDKGEYVYGDVDVRGFYSDRENTRCNVTVSWNGLSASFYVYIVCPHTDTQTQTNVGETVNGCSATSTVINCCDCHQTVYRAYQAHHVWNEGVRKTEPTCTTNGMVVYTCKNCTENFVEPIPALGHSYVEQNNHPATCTEDGYADYRCERCGATKRETLDRLGHGYVERDNQPATCTEDGYVEYGCVRCDATRRETLLKLGHSYTVTESRDATCTKDGFKTSECSKCKDVTTETLPALGHQMTHHEAVTPTDTEDGILENWSCSRCNNHYMDAEGNQQYQNEDWHLGKLGMVEKFNEQMSALDKNSFDSLVGALATYNGMSLQQKKEVAENYAVLQQAILAYNEEADKLNQSYDAAVNVVGYSLGGAVALSVLATLAFVCKKTFMR